MSEPLKIVITANGEGSRMKAISPKPKHLLYYGGKRIIERIIEALQPFGDVHVFGQDYTGIPLGMWMECGPTPNRKEHLRQLTKIMKTNILIVDCDVIPVFELLVWEQLMNAFCAGSDDMIVYFDSDNPKYGGLVMDENWCLLAAKERGQGQNKRASGLYFLKDVGATVDRMADPNSIASGMIGARMIFENTFVRVGDPEDYLNALK